LRICDDIVKREAVMRRNIIDRIVALLQEYSVYVIGIYSIKQRSRLLR
jgi:hypothetical protein